MENENTNWGQSVTAVVINDGKVLLARHTYGNGKNMLIIPGGYVNNGETPQNAVIREYREETSIEICPREIIGIRFNMRDWYIAFRADYISGEATSDNDENSEVIWLPVDEALARDDVPDLTKKLIKATTSDKIGLVPTDYIGNTQNNPKSLYCL